MPYWKGEKWAWYVEPLCCLWLISDVLYYCSYSCTKGHRSSKCTHYDRILYKVRKPGRPLNSCPHVLPDSIPPGTFVNTSSESMANGQPPNEACNCKNELVQVAIPKGVVVRFFARASVALSRQLLTPMHNSQELLVLDCGWFCDPPFSFF